MVPNLQIVEIPLTTIQPYWRNPRDYEQTLPALIKSIERYGFNVPLVVDKDNILVAGHARYKALQALGYEKAPCVVVEHLSPKEIQEIRLLDNRVQEFSTWDQKKLASSLQDVVSGSDVAGAFAGTLDRVVDLNLYAAEADPAISLGEATEYVSSEGLVNVDQNRCPFCDTPLSRENIVEDT